MCRKVFLLISVVLMLGSVSNAEDIQWTDLGADHLWSTPENWDLGRVPTLADDVRIDVPAAAGPNGPVIQDGIDAKANGIFTEAPGEPTLTMTGGTLEVADWIWWGDGADSFGFWVMSGGTVSVVNEFELGWGGGAGTLTMTGGTINTGEAVIPTGSGAFGELYLHGGTYNVIKADGLSVEENGLIDITEGTLVLEGDDTAKINDLIAAGLITAYGGDGKFEIDFDGRNPGKTTVTAMTGPPYIIWVSDFYDDNGDGAPDDQPWVDLLEAQGYTVDYTPGASPGDGYWRTLDDDKIAALNAADLIIVSRNSNSGDYADGDEPTQWNSVTTPLILQATHIVRSSRWRWLDTTTTNNATPTIQVLDLCNPVFSAVTLDVNGQVDIVTDANSTFAGTTDAGNGALIATRADTNDVAIIEWEAGVEFYPGAGQTAGGPRVYFPAGTQDTAPDIGRGEYNLTPEGERIFLDAVAVFVPPIVVSSDVTAPGDTVRGVPDDGDWPGNEAPPLAIDDNIETKYLHFKGDFEPDPGTGGSGFRVTPSACTSVVTGLTFTTANDVPGRDPIAFELYGSNESIDGPYELIATGDIVDFAQEVEWPRFTKNETPISFDNDVAYNHYQLIFPAIRGPVGGSVNSMQIAEVELLSVRRRCENIGIPSTCPPVMPTPIYSKTDSVGNLLELWCSGSYHLCFTPAGANKSCQIGECIFTKGENVGWVCYDPWGKFTSVTWLNYEGHDYPTNPASKVYNTDGDNHEDRDTYIYDVASGILTKTRHERELKSSGQSDPGKPWVFVTDYAPDYPCHCPTACPACPAPSSGITFASNVPRITPVRFVGSIQGGGQVTLGIHGTQVVVPTTAGMDVQQLAQQFVVYFNRCWQGPQGPQVPSQSQRQRQQQTKFASIDPGYGQVVQLHNVDEQEICIRVVGEPELTLDFFAYTD